MLGEYKKRLLKYVNKTDFDYKQERIHPYEYHTNFIAFAELFTVMDYDNTPYWMYISPPVVFVSALTAAIICFISLTEYIRNRQIHLITECATYFLVMCYKFLIINNIIFHKKQFHKLLQALRDDFLYICTKGARYRHRFFENQELTFKACVLTSIFIGAIGGGMSMLACIAVVVYLISNDGIEGVESGRPLPFPFWLFGYDLHATPVYEILFVMSIGFTFCHTYTYIFITQTQILWVRHIMCKADVIIWKLQDLLDDIQPAKNQQEEDYCAQLIRSRMREIIHMHHSLFKLTESYAVVYKKCLLYEQKLGGPIITMTAYGFAEKLDDGEFQGILLLLCTAIIFVMFVPSYLCTLLLEKVRSISDACWEIPFWNAGPVVRPYLILIMQRSMRKLPIVAAGFEDISLKTYSSTLTRCYSWFNMLRQGGLYH